MNTTLSFRGQTYTPKQIDRAISEMGYTHWVRAPRQFFMEFLQDDHLSELLTKDLTGSTDPYEQEIHAWKQRIETDAQALSARGITHVRLNVSWAEGDTPGGWQAIKWYLHVFHEQGLDILPNINYTPWRFAKARIDMELALAQESGDEIRAEKLAKKEPQSNIPPYPLSAAAEFTDKLLVECGHDLGEYVELWNEPNTPTITTDWSDFFDPEAELFVEMAVGMAAVVHRHGKKVLLGGPNKIDPWLGMVGQRGLYDHVDVLGFHGLRGTWTHNSKRPPFEELVRTLKEVVGQYTDRDLPVWITEVGFSVIDMNLDTAQERLEQIQVALFADLMLSLASGEIGRVYWYTLRDEVTDSIRKITTNWEDVLQHFFGDTDLAGNQKLLAQLLRAGGPRQVLDYVEEHDLWRLSDAFIDRGDPRIWTPEKTAALLEKIELQARERKKTTEKGESMDTREVA